MSPRMLVLLVFLLAGSRALELAEELDKPPADYEYVPEVGYYKLVRLHRKWSDAWRLCNEAGAHLAVVNSEREAEVLQMMYARYPNLPRQAFMGYHDVMANGEFATINGELASSLDYSKWAPEREKGSCAVIDPEGRLGGVDCNAKLPFFCEHERGREPRKRLRDRVKGAFNWGHKQFHKVAKEAAKAVHNMFRG